MNEDTKQFIEELKAQNDVVGVILFGSWARGNNRPDSDVDLIVIVTDGYRRTVEYKNKQAFEIIYTTAKSALEFWQSKKDDCANLWSIAKILYDKDETVEQLKERAEEIIKEGKKPIDEYQKGQLKFSAEDEIKAVESMMDTYSATANFVLAYTVLGLTSVFFDVRQLWTPAPKQRLAKIKDIKPELGALFEKFYSDIPLTERIVIAKNIVSIEFENNL